MNTTATATAWTFGIRSDIVITGSNPEMADVVNPRGHTFGLLWYVVASNAHGDTRELAVVSASDPEAAAFALAERLNARMNNLGKLPVGFDLWPAGRAVYGSDAYIEYGQADEVALERREAEDEAWGV